MGTRNLTVVISKGVHRVAQYGQWDGYPTGQGDTIAYFIQNKLDLPKFKQAVEECTFLSEEETKKRWKEAGADNSGWVGMDVSARFTKKYPQLSRDVGAGILELIQNGTRELVDSIEFAADSLFCEYAYVVNLDNE